MRITGNGGRDIMTNYLGCTERHTQPDNLLGWGSRELFLGPGWVKYPERGPGGMPRRRWVGNIKCEAQMLGLEGRLKERATDGFRHLSPVWLMGYLVN